MKKISLILTTYKATEHLICCVRSIVKARSPNELIEVVIYGDGGGEASRAAIESCLKVLSENGIHCIARFESTNIGICGALNRACEMATGEWLFVLNDDMVLPEFWFQKIGVHLLSNRVLSLTAIEPELPGRTVASCFVKENLGLDPINFDLANLNSFQNRLEVLGLEPGVNYPFFVERKVFFEIGAIDESFSGPYHDPDLYVRFKIHGLEMLRFMGCAVYHFSGVSLRFAESDPVSLLKMVRKTSNWIAKENAARLTFIRKWGVKPKAKFGHVPRVSVRAPWKDRSPSALEFVNFNVLIIWERIRGFLRMLRYRRG